MESSSIYNCSIFTSELVSILTNHHHTLDDLQRHPFRFDRQKVDGLKASLKNTRRLPALDPGELMTIVLQANLNKDEQRRLNAALLALGVQRLLLHYLDPVRVWNIANEVKDSVVHWQQTHGVRDDIFRHPFNRFSSNAGEDMRIIEDPLVEITNAIDEATALMTLSLFFSQDQYLLPQALLHVEKAQELFSLQPESVQQSEAGEYWSVEIEKRRKQIKDELE